MDKPVLILFFRDDVDPTHEAVLGKIYREAHKFVARSSEEDICLFLENAIHAVQYSIFEDDIKSLNNIGQRLNGVNRYSYQGYRIETGSKYYEALSV